LIRLPILKANLPVAVPQVVEQMPSPRDGAVPPNLKLKVYLCALKSPEAGSDCVEEALAKDLYIAYHASLSLYVRFDWVEQRGD
jgi:hypothetical protein